MTFICKTCHADFTRSPSVRPKYCSWECRSRKGVGGRPRTVPRALRHCRECSKSFECSVIQGRGVYCSKRCLGQANGRRIAANATGRAPMPCEECGTEFMAWKCTTGRRRFCSTECKYDAMRTGYEPRYGPDWPRQRRLARVRDNRTCQQCGVTDEIIHVHHVSPYRISKSNALDNLVCLCVSCHIKTEAALRAVERKQEHLARI